MTSIHRNAKTTASAGRAPDWRAPALALLLTLTAPALPSEHGAIAQLLPPPPAPLPTPLPLPPPDLVLAPPELPPIPSVPQVIPPDAPSTSGSTELPATSATLDAKLLIISADGNEPVLGAIRQAVEYAGIPYTLYVASRSPGEFTPAMLSDGDTHAFYQGIVMTTGTLAYFDGNAWASAFSPAEWQTLWDYQAKFRVRTAIAYAFPTADLGYGPPTGVDATATPVSASLTETGRKVFDYVNPANPVMISRAWTYLARPAGTGTNVLMSDPEGNALVLARTYPDGRQVLSLTFDGNFFLVHSLALMHGVVNWVTGGLFLGERHVYITPQIDDLFIDNDLYGGGTYRINAVDWAATDAWQTREHLDPQTSRLRLHMAFNGEGATGTYFPDLLSPAVDVTDARFPWINHTFTHENLDASSYETVYREITRNHRIADSLGFSDYDRRALVTPDVSGLANPDAMRAAYDAGIRYLVTDTSQPGMDNPWPQAGIYNPHEPRILMIPRRPTNLYYNVTTPAEWTNEYNLIYRGYWGRDLSYEEILDKESDVLLQYMLRGEIDPWMFHQSNLRAYDGVHTLLGDLLDRTLRKYRRIFLLPVRSLGMAAIGDWMKERMDYLDAGVRCSFRPQEGTVTLTATRAAVVPVTGLCLEGAEIYGGQCISRVALRPGESVTHAFDAAGREDAQPVAVEPERAKPGDTLEASLAPNPLTREGALSFRTSVPGFVKVRLFDLAGRLVRDVLNEAELPAGRHRVRIDGPGAGPGGLAAGVYLYRIEAREGSTTGRFVVTR